MSCHSKSDPANQSDPASKTDPVNLQEFEAAAREKLGKMAYDYYASGANDEITLKANRRAYEEIVIYPHMLRDVKDRQMRTKVLGQEIEMPVLVAPMAFQKMAHPEGEKATIKAAAAAGTIMILSTLASISIEEAATVPGANLWFQLYVYRDRELTAALVKRAEKAGCRALVFTVDSPILGRRENDVRNGFHLPEGISAANLAEAGVDALPGKVGESGLAHYIASLYDQSLSWKDVEWLRGITSLPVLVKGVLRSDDAELAVKHGAAGIIVSNHGGRQLDTAPATITVLKKIAETVGDRAEVFVDGGIRRGTDVLKAIACGAKAVLLGRPLLWGLAAKGETGAAEVLKLLKEELDLAMALSGCRSLAEIGPELLSP